MSPRRCCGASRSSRAASAGAPARSRPFQRASTASSAPSRSSWPPTGRRPARTAAPSAVTFPTATVSTTTQGLLWIYALPNPDPERALEALVLTPRDEESAVYAVALTQLADHPLRDGLRRRVRLAVPEGAALNAIGELDDVAVDLGTVISARAALEYDAERWLGTEPSVHPTASTAAVLVDYAAHPAARLYVGSADSPLVFDLAAPAADLTVVPVAERPVRVRVVDAETGAPVPVRLHIHGEAGEYLPPRGHHRRVNGAWFEDHYGELVANGHQYAYVDGDCVVDLPLGTVYVEITRGYEIAPVRRTVTVDGTTESLTFELERVLHWRERGWVTADTHVHFLSPQTALLEGSAEGVNVVNLLASQWGEMFSNVGRLRRADDARCEGARRRRRVPRARRLREPHAGARPHLAARVLRLSDPPALHRWPVRVGDRRPARGDDGRVGQAVPRPARAGGHAACARTHSWSAPPTSCSDLVDAIELMIFNPLEPGSRPQRLRNRRLVPLPQPGLPDPPRRGLGQDGRLDASRRDPHLRAPG